MQGSLETRLAEKYLVEDLPGAALSGARLNGILRKVEAGEALTAAAQSFLSSSGLFALQALAIGQIDLGVFHEQAAHERTDRIQRAKVKADHEAADRTRQAAARDAAIKAHFTAMENDPRLRRKREARELRDRFGIGYVEPEHYRRVMSLLKQVSHGERLAQEDVVWLSTEASDYWTDTLQQAWHRLEAEALTKAWKTNGDVWDAVNASKHWRRAEKPDIALEVTEAALTKAVQAPKPRSALATTRGGAMRDVGRLADAEALGMEAHLLTPADFRPCTLLGAVYIERGDLMAGHEWYQKAESLGADHRAIDQDLKALLARSEPKERERIRAFLLAQDPRRFAWCATTWR